VADAEAVDVGGLLVRARARATLSRTELASLAGTSSSAISAYERGAKSPTVATLDRLLRACGLQIRPELEPYLADLDAAVDALLAGPAEPPHGVERIAAAFDEAGVAWAFDGSTALALYSLGPGGDTHAQVVAAASDELRRLMYGLGGVTLRVVAALERPVRIGCGEAMYPVLSLWDIERAHPQLADVLGRLRERRTV
jgi:transcriptional regulator with XRE-family HTH domain